MTQSDSADGLKRIAAAGTAALTISGGAATLSGNLDKFAGNVWWN